MNQSTPLLEAVRLRRLHPDGQHRLLDDVSLTLHPGRPLAVLGRSGAGKTLLLRAVAVLDPLDSGEVRFGGTLFRRASVPLLRRRVIYLHQRPVLTGPTVEASLRRPFSLATHRHRPFDADRVVDLLARVGRDASFLHKSTADLSGGEQQLAALVRAVQLDPIVLLLDEPTASLDRDAARAVETLLADWLDHSPATRSFVWVAHDADQAKRMTRDAVFLQDGRVVEEPRGWTGN